MKRLLVVALLLGCTPPPTPTEAPSPEPTPSPSPLALVPGSIATQPPMDVLPTPIPTTSAPATADSGAHRSKPSSRPRTQRRQVQAGDHIRVSGYATWFESHRALSAAAGPTLRRALGSGWRGSRVLVCQARRCVEVKLTDWCACGKRHGTPTVLDLSTDAFRYLAPLSRGVITVQVEGIR